VVRYLFFLPLPSPPSRLRTFFMLDLSVPRGVLCWLPVCSKVDGLGCLTVRDAFRCLTLLADLICFVGSNLVRIHRLFWFDPAVRYSWRSIGSFHKRIVPCQDG
jgi:hypothetical protein